MYSRNGDRRVPQGISIPDNYRGNAFSPNGSDEAVSAHINDRQRGFDKDCREQQYGEGNGSQCGEAQGNHAEPCDTPSCNVRQEAQCECGANDRSGHGCDHHEDDRDGCGKENCRSSPPPACREGFMNLSIGNEELLLLGVMALIFFGDGKRDNELLLCLLLVLLI